MDSHKKNDITNKRMENIESIESEEETVDLNFLQEQKLKQNKDKFLLRKKRQNKERIEKKNGPSLNRDVNKYKEQGNYIRTEKKININAENPIEYQNLNKMSQNMEAEFEYKRQKKIDLISKFQHQLEITNRKIKELQEQNLKLNSIIEELRFKFNSKLEEQKVAQEVLKFENYRLQQSFKEKITLENKLLEKVDQLKDQVDELNEFHFKAKLRKLLKNLIEYLFQQFYPNYIFFNKETNKIKFFLFPRNKFKTIEFIKENKIITILNNLLDKIFIGAKSNDYIVHFVEQRAEDNPYYRRYINVFKNTDDFFQYFNIHGIDRFVLLQIIPPNYFMEIDNFKFDKSIRDIIRNYANIK